MNYRTTQGILALAVPTHGKASVTGWMPEGIEPHAIGVAARSGWQGKEARAALEAALTWLTIMNYGHLETDLQFLGRR